MRTALKTADKASIPGDRVFDARPDRLDFRDLLYRPPLRSLHPCFPFESDLRRFLPAYVEQGLILDQGKEGACTGFGLACVANYLLWIRHLLLEKPGTFESVSPRMFYELAKRYDEWPGQDYEGSSCRGALKGWNKHGVCSVDFWPYPLKRDGTPIFARPKTGWEACAAQRPLGVYYRVNRESVVDLQAAIVEIGAVYVSAAVHDGWDALVTKKKVTCPESHSALPIIARPHNPKKLGGHAFALVGYNKHGFIVQNSWGLTWGASGFAILPYDDWVAHGTDAWVCALGVPVCLPVAGTNTTRAVMSSRWRMASGQSLTALANGRRLPQNPADDPWPIDHEFECLDYQPWSTAQAYSHTLVMGNDGELVVTDFTRASDDHAGMVQELVEARPQQWLANKPLDKLKLAIYVHGGLNSEDDSIQRIRVLAPYFLANDIYPLFLTWKTGVVETLGGILEDLARRLFGAEPEDRSTGLLDKLADARDRAMEATAHVVARGLWSQMCGNAELGIGKGHGTDLLVNHLYALQNALKSEGKALELHLVGHSAGSIVIGHLLDRLKTGNAAAVSNKLSVKTCALYAAACTARFAVGHYLAAAKAHVIDMKQLWMYVLSDANEKQDGLPTPTGVAYGKSLLYLVSRALDDVRKTPLLGMERALEAKYAHDEDQWNASELFYVRQWQAEWSTAATEGQLKRVSTPKVTCTRTGDEKQATHGSFDNNIEVLTDTLQRIKQAPLIAKLEWLDY